MADAPKKHCAVWLVLTLWDENIAHSFSFGEGAAHAAPPPPPRTAATPPDRMRSAWTDAAEKEGLSADLLGSEVDKDLVFQAAWHVQDAIDGVERAHPTKLHPGSRWAQLVHLNGAPMLQALRMGFVALSFFELPWWAGDEPRSTLHARFPLSGLPLVDPSAGASVEVCCIAALVGDWALQLRYQGWVQLATARWPVATLALLLLSAVELAATPTTESRFAPFLRIGLYIASDSARPLRRQMLLITHILKRFGRLLVLTALFLGAFTWLGMVVFAGTDQARAAQPDGGEFAWAFSSLPATAWSLFVLMTTSNSPDVIMPAYNGSRWAALFFTLFVSVGVFFVSNFLLSIVYHEYTTEHAAQALEHAALREGHLRAAFALLAADRVRDGLRVVEKSRLLALFRELNSYRRIEYISRDKALLLHAMLDSSGDSLVNREDFCRLCELLLIEFVRVDGRSAEQPRFGTWLREHVVGSARFAKAVDGMLVLNLLGLVLTTRGVIANVGEPAALSLSAGRLAGWLPLFYFATALFLAEMSLKVFARSWRHFWGDSAVNRFDLGVTLGMAGCAIALALPASTRGLDEVKLVRISIMLQSLRCWEPIRHVQQFGVVFDIFGRTLPIAAEMSQMLFVCLYIFSAIGLACFGGLVMTDETSHNYQVLAETDYGSGGITMGNWANNFNDMSSGMVLLFEALVVNNWFEFADGFAAVTSAAANWYFVIYYVFSVVIVFNVVTSIVLDVFLAHYTADGGAAAHTVDGEAVILGNRAVFEAADITGTETGLDGQYEARVGRSQQNSMTAHNTASDLLVTAFTRSEETGEIVRVRVRASSLVAAADPEVRARARSRSRSSITGMPSEARRLVAQSSDDASRLECDQQQHQQQQQQQPPPPPPPSLPQPPMLPPPPPSLPLPPPVSLLQTSCSDE